jgi:Fe-S-cluster containining protein
VPREDFGAAVRFVADGAMHGTHRAARVEGLLRAVVRALAESGQLDIDAFERHLKQPPPRPKDRAALELGAPVDKYTVSPPPDLDCAALIPICGARCCMLTFSLGSPDLEESRLAWSYEQPYRIAASAADHRCVHQDRATGGCTVYEHRPAICRSYDCRTDARIWQDFERRIPAPLEAVLPARRK